MTLLDLIYMTRLYTRDNNSYVFSETMIRYFINQGIDRIRQYKIFSGMEHLDYLDDTPTHLPSQYHYMLALFAASRCFDHDERHYEGVEKRNEFEALLSDLIADIECGNLKIVDKNNKEVVSGISCADDFIKDAYFDVHGGEE